MSVVKTLSIKLNPSDGQRRELDSFLQLYREGVNFCLRSIREIRNKLGEDKVKSRYGTVPLLYSTRKRAAITPELDLTRHVLFPIRTHYDSVANHAYSVWSSYVALMKKRQRENERLMEQLKGEDERLRAYIQKRLKRLRDVSFPVYRRDAALIHKSLVKIKNRKIYLTILSARQEFDYWGKTYLQPFLEDIEYSKMEKRPYLIKRKDDFYLQFPYRVHVKIPPPHEPFWFVSFDFKKAVAVKLENGEIQSVQFFNMGELKRVKDRYREKRRILTTLHKDETEKDLHGRRRLVKKMGAKERRFVRSFNHQLTRNIVNHVAEEGCGTIMMINMSGLKRIRYNNPTLNQRLSSWSVREQQNFLTHKAAMEGIPTVLVPYSKVKLKCPKCGAKTKEKIITKIVKHEKEFKCPKCKYQVNLHIALAYLTYNTHLKTSQSPPKR